MDVLFVDVGFGTCNIILIGSGEAIIIDAGKRSKEPLAVLHHFSVTRIPHLIVSHWHDDHVGGGTGVLRAFSDKIGEVWFPSDPAFKRTEFWDALTDENSADRIKDEQIKPLMIGGASTIQIWSSKVHDAELRIVSPCFMEVNRGVAAGDSNATCGIIVLRVGQQFIVFAGDATLAQWQQVPKRVAVPILAEVLAIPHHAGIMWPNNWSDPQIRTALDNLYTKIVRPRIAIISASTAPGEKHPREEVVAAIRRANASIICTQITQRCTSDLEAARTLQTSLPTLAPGRSSPTPQRTRGSRPSNVACAGSIFVELLASGATLHQLAPHQTFVNRLPNLPGQLPLCRR